MVVVENVDETRKLRYLAPWLAAPANTRVLISGLDRNYLAITAAG